jgi:hypothetical protein
MTHLKGGCHAKNGCFWFVTVVTVVAILEEVIEAMQCKNHNLDKILNMMQYLKTQHSLVLDLS